MQYKEKTKEHLMLNQQCKSKPKKLRNIQAVVTTFCEEHTEGKK
jgi:hypothetical protein